MKRKYVINEADIMDAEIIEEKKKSYVDEIKETLEFYAYFSLGVNCLFGCYYIISKIMGFQL